MKVYDAPSIRNVALVGHGGCGKTSLASAMLFDMGAVNRLGRVDDGTTTTDFDPDEIKPSVCRLYPLTHDERRLGLSPDFDRYSCANDAGPRVYRLMRDVLRVLFGAELIAELDRVEAEVLRRSLPVLRAPSPSLEP